MLACFLVAFIFNLTDKSIGLLNLKYCASILPIDGSFLL